MKAKNIYCASYREKYFEGYSIGFNPFLQINSPKRSIAFKTGFLSGKMDYESMNGLIANGIPQRIVTKKILEDFMLSGMLGLKIDSEGYTLFQLSVIREWYVCGIEMYDPKESTCLLSILEENGIEIK